MYVSYIYVYVFLIFLEMELFSTKIKKFQERTFRGQKIQKNQL